MQDIHYRRFGPDDLEEVGKVFASAVNDLLAEAGLPPYVDLSDDAAWAQVWERDRRSLFEHLASSGSESWLAEQNGQILGYARSILRDGVRQLTEFFVLPNQQLGGIGRELIARTFASQGCEGRIVISTLHGAAMARYLKSGVYPLCPVCDFARKPERVAFESDLAIEPMSGTSSTLEALDAIDQAVLGYRRAVDHRWLIADRSGFLYRRDGKAVGYGYVGRWSGPFALLESQDFPAVLAHAETEAAAIGDNFVLHVPMVNRAAVDYLLSRGFRMEDKFLMLLMADTPRPRLDRYVISYPAFFV